MAGLFNISNHKKRLEELDQARLLSEAEVAANQDILKHKVIKRIGVFQTLAIGASAGCIAALLSNNREIIEQIKNLPVEELISAAQTYTEHASNVEEI